MRRALAMAAAALLALWACGSAGAADDADEDTMSTADVQVIDGDTLQLGPRIVQLHGIDAPELGQRCYHDSVWIRCGLNAAFELNKLIHAAHRDLHCKPPAEDAGTGAEVCLVGQHDVANVLLEGGYVMASPEADDGYRETEAAARRAGLGLWHAEFLAPTDWRAGRRMPNERDSEDEACPVKGTVSAAGERLYHVPTDEGYQDIAIDESRGERLFCSDEAAREAGWRRPGEAPDGG